MTYHFLDLRDPKVIEEIESRTGRTRWVLLIGDRTEHLFDYMLSAIEAYPKGRRHLGFAGAPLPNPDNTFTPELRMFLEKHMVSSTPMIMLVRRGESTTTISGAIPFDRLHAAIDELMTDTPQDRLLDAYAEAEAQIAFPVLPAHRTQAQYHTCATCDGGGCPDCTDPA
ncbi:hypothetical protein [Gordonia phage GTE5]|uniref:Thioredoxin n=1 Tax=Gordonia phage GTE5 TaxID=319522 RepID=G8EJR8_9CAUD|nr:thioredoxin domain [Gordonia phage GTE5]AET09800.1 hypothetical protein [Gordonia phage GTE5]